MTDNLITIEKEATDHELVTIAQSITSFVESELERIEDQSKVKDLKTKTIATADYLRRTIRDRRLRIDAVNDLTYSTILTNRWLDDWWQENGAKPGERVDLSHRATGLHDLGISRDEASRNHSQNLVPANELKEYYEAVKASGDQLTIGAIVDWGKRIKGGELLTSDTIRINARANNVWYTPSCYIESARIVLGSIDLDPASSAEANETVMAETFFTEETDGLLQAWCGKVWLNPPYGRISAEFALKLITDFEIGNVDEAILLINSNTTDTNWFQPLWNYTLCFTDHRIDFYSPQNIKAKGSTHGSLFVYFGQNIKNFLREFSKYGAIVRRLND